MKFKAKYSAESDIPSDVKAFYVLKDGEWVFEGSEFEGLAELLNPGLAANKDIILEEKRTALADKQAAEKKLGDVERELGTYKKPGSVIMTDDDKKTLDEYKALGTVKDVQAKLENETAVSSKLAAYDTEKELRFLAEEAGLDPDALVDFKLNSERGKDVTLRIATKKVKDAKGTEVETKVPVVVITNNVNGKDKEEEKDFGEFAKERHYPQYLVDAIFAKPADTKKTTKDETVRKPFSVPVTTKDKTSSSNGDETPLIKKMSAKFNAERSTRTMPWSTRKQSENTKE